MTSIEELEHLRTRAEKSRHDVLPPQLGARHAHLILLPTESIRRLVTINFRNFNFALDLRYTW